ncbi:hypothetical protein E7T09_12940 [Deinococcus sp. KSM4-11]|uniref:TOTE conflict system archaeo-eukaryotic primase domain-containing protein n=1 Tax=Deinococcus sp. KSM4-11 TaxID=2568654 RepID=UPI0010A51630|nr:hypothetical protein [Deinococcus sp. KSM4-11]THF86130.1 hypothetical protein E7T09_12940 [Deinococcus sp. KSM4-11]
MTSIAEDFAQFFPMNPMKHGRVTGRDAEGHKQVKTYERAPVTLQSLSAHLGENGRTADNALGYLPGSEDGTDVGALDLDAKDFPGDAMPEALRAVLETCAGLNLNAYPERSSSGKGWHVWTFSDSKLPWPVMAHALARIRELAGLRQNVETYPMGTAGVNGRWIITPYSRALSGQKGIRPRLGATFLETPDGQPIPVDELGEWITRNPAQRLQELAAQVKSTPTKVTMAKASTSGDLDAAAVPLLLHVATSKAPPARHDAASAFLNLGARAGDLAGMLDGLASAAVFSVWCADGSRTPEQWRDELARWATAIETGGGEGRGLPYLRDVCGYDVPSLPKPDKADSGEKEGRRPNVGTRLLQYVQEDGAELWHDQAGVGYITVSVEGRREHYRLGGPASRDYFTKLVWDRDRSPIHSQGMSEALGVMGAIARREGEQHHTGLRVKHLDGCSYLDLGTPSWEAVEVGAGYWKVIPAEECPVRFTRPAGLLPLPTPITGGELGELAAFLNTDARGLMMCTAWLAAGVSGMGPYPLLALTGEQGTGKSTLASLCKRLIDPHQAERRRPPKTEQDLFVGAQSGHVQSYDNLSSIPPWLSDGLCVLSTGGAVASRTLYSDSEETILEAVRPVIVNGIPDLMTRPDLAERAITVTLHRIPSNERLTERAFWTAFEEARPRMLGALLTALAESLRNLETTELAESPRLADFARLIVAGEATMPWEAGTFLAAYAEMQTETASAVLEGDPVSEALRRFMDDQDEWTGTVKKLLTILGEREYPDSRPPQSWPRTPRGLGGSLRRLAPALSKTGYLVTPAGRSKDGERYSLQKRDDSTYTSCTTYTGAVLDDEKQGVRSNVKVHPEPRNVHPAALIPSQVDHEEVLAWE